MNSILQIKPAEQENVAEADLLLIAGNKYISYAVVNNQAKEIFEFGYYELQSENEWQNVFRESELLSRSYRKSFVAFNMTESMLIPSIFYQHETLPQHFEAIHGINGDRIFVTDQLTALNTHCVSAVPIAVHAALSRKFESADFKNLNTVLLEKSGGEKKESVLLDFRTDEFTVIVFKENILQLAQIFSYAAPEDVLYYLLKICQQINLSQQEVHITLSGLIEKDSSVYRELYKYFIHLEFDELPASIKIAEELKAYPVHYFSTICKLASCV